ncbi:MAG TPA: tetratricopeptide repeat protein [Chitinophagaceae bacterium]|nr:tetratricopeptide repeat protein [Chitinophagaceae bacterium]
MKKIILLFIVSLSISYINAQTGNRDSIIQLLQKDKEDTSRVLHLADLSFEYSESKPDTTMVLALEALSLARRIGFEKGAAVSLNRVGNAYHTLGNYPKAMEVYLQALKINERINNVDGKQKNLGNIGVIYNEQEDYRQALDYYFKAKTMAEQLNNKRSLSIACVNIAEAYHRLKIYDSATQYAQQANDIAYKINYGRLIGSSLLRLGRIHFEKGQTSSALEHYRISIPYAIKSKNDLRLSETSLDIAKVFKKMGQNDSVLFYANQSLLLAKEKGFTKQIRDAGRFLSAYYRNMRIQDSAYFYQDVTKAANDSLFSQEKQRKFQSLGFDEKLRQQEIEAAVLKAKEERNHNLQYAAIAIGLITFIILFLALSRSIVVKQKFIEFFAILGLLAVFEFINLFIHPYLANITNNSPVLMLIILIAIGALLIPLHHKLQKWITNIMVEKNKKIRLAAAKKTIAILEGESRQ